MIHNDATPAYRGRSRDLRGARRRRAADLRAGHRPADGAALFPVLRIACGRAIAVPCRGALADAEAAVDASRSTYRRPAPPPRIGCIAMSGSRSCSTCRGAHRLSDGDGLELDDGRYRARCVPPTEPVLEIAADARPRWLRIAWHLGNRHLPVQIADERAAHPRATMSSPRWCAGSAAGSTRLEAPFDPESGAYARSSPCDMQAQRIATHRGRADAGPTIGCSPGSRPAFPIGAYQLFATGSKRRSKRRCRRPRQTLRQHGSRDVLWPWRGRIDADTAARTPSTPRRPATLAALRRGESPSWRSALRATCELALESAAQGAAFLATRAAPPGRRSLARSLALGGSRD